MFSFFFNIWLCFLFFYIWACFHYCLYLTMFSFFFIFDHVFLILLYFNMFSLYFIVYHIFIIFCILPCFHCFSYLTIYIYSKCSFLYFTMFLFYFYIWTCFHYFYLFDHVFAVSGVPEKAAYTLRRYGDQSRSSVCLRTDAEWVQHGDHQQAMETWAGRLFRVHCAQGTH